MPRASSDELLCLHAVRILGGCDTARIAGRFGLDYLVTAEMLLDFQAIGWVTRSEFADDVVWSLTPAGRVENERHLAVELDSVQGRPQVANAHVMFLPLNARFQQAVTAWQLSPMPGGRFSTNDHTDFRYDDRILQRLASIGTGLADVCAVLASQLSRLGGYSDRYRAALRQAQAGQFRWVDSIEVDSCHTAWMQLHEDLLATLGVQRGHD